MKPISEFLKIIETGTPNERWRAARNLVKSGHKILKNDLLKMYEIDDFDIKQAILFIIGKTKGGTEFSEIIINGLESKDSNIFRTACNTARELRYSKVAKLITKGLNSKSIATVLSSLHGLEYAWNDNSFVQVFQVYKNHKSIKVKKAAAYSLWRNASLENWKFIFDSFSKDDIDRHRIFACKIASKFDGQAVLESLQKLSSDKNGHIRWHSNRTIEQLMNENKT